MADKEKQIKNSFIYLLPIIVGNILPLIALPIFTRILTKEDYGLLALVMIYALFVAGLANFGMTVVYDRNFFQYRNNSSESAKLFYSILAFVVLNFLVLAGVTYLFRETFSRLITGSAGHGNILFWSFCAQLFVSINYYCLSYFKNSEMAKSFSIYTIAGSVLNLAIALWLVMRLRIGVIGMVYSQVLSGAIISGLLGYKFAKFLRPSFSKRILIESMKISYPLTPLIFFGVIGSQFDKYMIGLLASVGGVGIYSIGQSIAYVVFNFMTAIQNVFSPQVYKRMFELEEKRGETIGRYLTPFCYVSIFVGLLISLFAEEIIFILTPQAYHGATDIIIILSMLYGAYFFSKQPQLIYAKKTHISSLLAMGSICLNIVLNIPFIMKFGAIGAAWGTLTAGIITVAITFIASQYYYPIKWEYRKIIIIYFFFYASSFAMLLMRQADLAYWIRLIIKSAVVVSYTYYGVKLGLLTRENFILVKNMLPWGRPRRNGATV